MASETSTKCPVAGDAPVGWPAMVVGVDDSEHSHYALQWALEHFFAGVDKGCPAPFSLVVVHAKPYPASMIALDNPGAAHALPFVDSGLRKIAAGVVEKARELCVVNSVGDVLFEVAEGDARNVLCEAVEKHQARMLVVGSHGYGAIKRAVLGSVSDYCAHHAHCSVLIVKKPKTKH
ncbi:hypothetical protein Taro_027023 [Colocasia esculenta]|uniref:UspA domain-containing protein n=1 Tax=Colocasia esculenta TaxID=4460 RepID=A0A843VLA5_COLES|nr:hypothetical protein [Colocasia esculenta]